MLVHYSCNTEQNPCAGPAQHQPPSGYASPSAAANASPSAAAVTVTAAAAVLFCRDETTVLAFNGLCKVLRAHMTTVLAIPGINDKWDETCKIASQALMSGRKSVAIAAAQLLTGVLQVR
jgi:hypothetical protein